jgi:hypothetical protein
VEETAEQLYTTCTNDTDSFRLPRNVKIFLEKNFYKDEVSTMREKISEFLEKAISMAERRGKEVRGFRVSIVCEEDKVESVKAELRRLGVKVIGSIENIIVADVPDTATLEKVAAIEGVEYVTMEKIFWPMGYGIDEIVKRLMIAAHPILGKLSTSDLEKLGFTFKPTVEIPNPILAQFDNIAFLTATVLNPRAVIEEINLSLAQRRPPVFCRVDWKLVTETRKLMDAPDNNKTNLFVGVIDSGVSPHPATPPGTWEQIVLTVDAPADTMGHGMWVTSCAFGRPTKLCRYGDFIPVSQARKILHVKVFSAVGGCTGYQVMKAMEICARKGCKVVNMSLGGTLTDPVDKDPECILVEKLTKKYGTIFCIAAGNEDGEWEIASPGASPYAITVAAFDWKTLDVSSYSSRGPQGKYYKDHKDVFEEHLNKYGENFLKPDVGGIGGDRKSQIVSAVTGWYDGIWDFMPDGWECMIGTSMATPHVAGVTNLLLFNGKIKTAQDIKDVMKTVGKEKCSERGYGLLKYSYF